MAHMWNVPGAESIIARSRELQGRLLAEAQHHGLARQELTTEDIAVACWSLQGILDTTRGLPVNAWQRHLEILLAGLAPAAHALANPTLTPQEMDTVIKANKLDPQLAPSKSAQTAVSATDAGPELAVGRLRTSPWRTRTIRLSESF